MLPFLFDFTTLAKHTTMIIACTSLLYKICIKPTSIKKTENFVILFQLCKTLQYFAIHCNSLYYVLKDVSDQDGATKLFLISI